MKRTRNKLGWTAALLLAAAFGAWWAGALGAADERSPGRESLRPANAFEATACLVSAQKVDVPAEEAGALKKIYFRENQEVKPGELIAEIDDSQAKKAQATAAAKVAAGEKEAESDVEVRLSVANIEVAKAEKDQYEKACKDTPNTFSTFELRRKQFEYVAAMLRKDKSMQDMQVAQLKVDVQKAELASVDLDVERRKIKAPLAGLVNYCNHEEGEWVKPGDPVLQIIPLGTVRVVGELDERLNPEDVDGQPVKVTVKLRGPAGVREEVFDGKITFPDPEVVSTASGTWTWKVRADVTNRKNHGYWMLRPGMEVKMVITPRK
jgi:multidrug efflux pump subunit AcrA (membrane-fusion protein)